MLCIGARSCEPTLKRVVLVFVIITAPKPTLFEIVRPVIVRRCIKLIIEAIRMRVVSGSDTVSVVGHLRDRGKVSVCYLTTLG